MNKRVLGITILVAVVLFVSACGSLAVPPPGASPSAETQNPDPVPEQIKGMEPMPEPTPTPTPEPVVKVGGTGYETGIDLSGEGELYYMITFDVDNDFWKSCYSGFQRAANLYGASTEYTGTVGNSAYSQIELLKEVAEKKPAGIAIAVANGEVLAEPIREVTKQGIPVITIDSSSPGSGALSALTMNDYRAGRIAGEILAGYVGEEGVISGTLVPNAQNQEERWRGVRDVIAEKYSGIQIINPVNGEYKKETGAAQVKRLLEKNPEIGALFACDATAGEAVAEGIGRLEDPARRVSVLAFDNLPATMDLLENRVLTGALVQNRETMGYWGLQYLFAINHNLVVGANDWQEANPLPHELDTGVTLVTPELVDKYREDWSHWKN